MTSSRESEGVMTRTSLVPERRRIPVILALALLVLAALGPVVDNGFIDYDDDVHVTANPVVKRGITLEGLRWAFTSFGYSANWYPLTWLSHMLDVQIFGLDPRGHHAVNLLLHSLATILLYLVLARMTGALWKSALVAALFGVHPLHVESVAWVAERKDVLAGVCFMLTLLSYARYVTRRSGLRLVRVLGFLALALLAKPTAVTLPFVLLLLDWWPLGRLRAWLPAGRSGAGGGTALPGLLLEKAPMLAMSAVASAVTYRAQMSGGGMLPTNRYPPFVRLGNALDAYVRYLAKTVWPSRLSVFYPHPGDLLDWSGVAASAALLLLVTLVAFRFSAGRPYLFLGWAWYLGTLVPVIGLVQVGFQSMADRYTYLPLVGIFLAFSWGIGDMGKGPPPRQLAAVLLAVSLLGLLSAVSRIQAGYWRDTLSIFDHAARSTGGNWLALNHVGSSLAARGDREGALAKFSQALRFKPDYDKARYNLAGTLLAMGRTEEAIGQYREVLRRNPYYMEAYNNLGVALYRQGKTAEALSAFEYAVRYKPDYADARYNLGLLLQSLGRTEEAISQYRTALALKPEDGRIRSSLDQAFRESGRVPP